MIKISNLSFAYDKSNKIFENLNVHFRKGEISMIIGPSGSGKSTLLKLISKDINKNDGFSGNIYMDDNDISEMEKEKLSTRIGIVTQDPDTQLIFPTVIDELAFGLENLCVQREEILHKIEEISKLLNINHLLQNNPRFLSGGEKQLVILASALIYGVDILLLDESMAQIDSSGKKIIIDALKILRADDKTIIMVEHDLNNLHLADSVYKLESGAMEIFKRSRHG